MPRRATQAQINRSNELVWTRGSSSGNIGASTSGVILNFSTALASATGDNPRNWTIERIIGQLVITCPAASTARDSTNVYLGIDVFDADSVAGGNMPEPFSDNKSFPWVMGRTVFVPEVPSASLATPMDNGYWELDLRSKRRARGFNESLVMFGYHDNGLGANPAVLWNYSALWRLHA